MNFSMTRLAIIVVILAFQALPAAEARVVPDWPIEFYDPGAERGDPADLVLPLPCGGGMAFQKIEVPTDPENPLSDRPLRLGASDQESGYLDYFVRAYLRGAFEDGDTGNTHYFLARYELTGDQFAAIENDCRDLSVPGRIPKSGLSWFDAVDLGRKYTEWLRSHAAEDLPSRHGIPAFVRLPTETEWEYAARGGSRVDALAFGARRFFESGEGIDSYAWHQGTSRNKARPVGTRKPNPLGLFDIYGNMEELVLEPFRMNAVGRPHGQPGGVVTRGGSFRSIPGDLYSARRTEWPLFRISDGRPSAEDSFGVRFVLSTHVSVSDHHVAGIRDKWMNIFLSPVADFDDPVAEISGLIQGETDARRRAQLERIGEQINLERRTRVEVGNNFRRSLVRNGALLLWVIRDSNNEFTQLSRSRARLKFWLDRETDASKRREFEENLAATEFEMERQRPVRIDSLQSYAEILEIIASSADLEKYDEAIDLLQQELETLGRDQLQGLVEEFRRDLELYLERRDMSGMELLDLAVES